MRLHESEGVGEMTFIDGIINIWGYTKTLADNMPSRLQRFGQKKNILITASFPYEILYQHNVPLVEQRPQKIQCKFKMSSHSGFSQRTVSFYIFYLWSV